MQIALWHFDQVLSSLRVRLSCEVPLTLFSLFFFFLFGNSKFVDKTWR